MAEPRITAAVLAVLVALREDPSKPRYGLEIASTAEVSHTTIYDTLARLEAAKWLTSEWEVLDPSEEGRPRRRLYRLTAEGDAVAREKIDAQFQALAGARARRRTLPRLRPST
jgi:DNA-binding PadR family transcriptional regulator